ncbi:hypothetical protein, partial [Roseateles oligotrophus]
SEMRVHILPAADGTPFAFEVGNLLLTRGQACRVVESIPGAEIVRRSRLFRDTSDFCEFRIGDDVFVIEEPFGDNSRYWIGPKNPEGSSSIGVVRRAFESHESWRLLGRIAILLAIASGAVWALIHVQTFIAQDRCLDSGGRWEYSTSSCTREASDG